MAPKAATPKFSDAAKPFYAYVGAGDRALEAFRTWPETAAARSNKFQSQAKGIGGLITTSLRELPGAARQLPGQVTKQAKSASSQLSELPDVLKTLPAQATKVPEQALAGVKTFGEQLQSLSEKANDRYTGLATRGETLVTSIRKQGANQQVKKSAKNTASSAKRTRTNAEKTAAASGNAVSDAASKIGE